MEASGVVIRLLPCFLGAGIDAHSSHHSSLKPSSFPGELRLLCPPAGEYRPRASVKPRKFNFYGVSGSSVLCDDGHVQYYSWSTTTRCGGGKKQEKKIKKRLKLLKGLSRDLSTFSEMHFGLDPDPDHGLAHQVKGKMISEAADLLLGQLQLLRAEEKELKRKRKEDQAQLKVTRMHDMLDCEVSSSSSSSESIDGECGEVVDMNRLKREAVALETPNELQPAVIQEAVLTHSGTVAQAGNTIELQPAGTQQAILTFPTTLVQAGGNTAEEWGFEVLCTSPITTDKRSCSSTGSSTSASHVPSSSDIVGDVGRTDGNSLLVTGGGASGKNNIEVCMGGKCKKSGAASLLEEFQRVVGGEAAPGSVVVGCKCMGKCRYGPNVRVNLGTDQDSVRTPTNPLWIGVGLEDVGSIVANFIGGKNYKDLGLAAAVAASS